MRKPTEPYRPRHAAWLREQPALLPHDVWHQQLREAFPAAFADDPGPVVFDLDAWLSSPLGNQDAAA